MRVKRKTTEPTRKQNYSTDNASSSFSTCRHCGGHSRRAHGVSVIVSGIEVSNSPCVASIHGDDRIVHTHPNTRTQTHALEHTRSSTRTQTHALTHTHSHTSGRYPRVLAGLATPSGPHHATPCKKPLQLLFKVSHLLPHHLLGGWGREISPEGGPKECFCLSAFV